MNLSRPVCFHVKVQTDRSFSLLTTFHELSNIAGNLTDRKMNQFDSLQYM